MFQVRSCETSGQKTSNNSPKTPFQTDEGRNLAPVNEKVVYPHCSPGILLIPRLVGFFARFRNKPSTGPGPGPLCRSAWKLVQSMSPSKASLHSFEALQLQLGGQGGKMVSVILPKKNEQLSSSRQVRLFGFAKREPSETNSQST